MIDKMKKQQMTYPYILQRMRRKSISLSVTPAGEVLVKAPLRMSEQAIRAFVQKHEGWIQEHLHIAEEQRKKYAEAPAQVRFLGKDCRVQLWQEKQVCLQDGVVYLPELEDAAKQRAKLTAWYRQQAKELLGRRIEHWAQRMGCSYAKLRISGARKRWGSCTSEGTVSLAWRLMMASPREVDYVIVHELAHRTHMDHSREFWMLVAKYCPEHEMCRRMLKDTSEWMHQEGWDL